MEKSLQKYVDKHLYRELREVAESRRVSEHQELDIYEKTIKNKEGINDLTIQFLENILSNNLASTKQEKLTVISLLDEFNYRNEVLQLMEKKNQSSVKKAAKSLGKKFVTSVE